MEEIRKNLNQKNIKRMLLAKPEGITRSEAAGSLGIDLRTASGHLEKLTALGFAERNFVVSGGKGRPNYLYKTNPENFCFLGICIPDQRNAFAAVIDVDGNILYEDSAKLPADTGRQASFEAILAFAQGCCSMTPQKKNLGIGIAISRSLQPPMAGEDVYSGLAVFLQTEMKIPVYRDLIVNIRAFALAWKFNYKNLALIHPGKALEFGLVYNHLPQKNFAAREKWLSHLCVSHYGKRCYCGKRGCLENYVTSRAIAKRLKVSANAMETLEHIGEKFGIAMVCLAEKYNIEAVFIMDGDGIFPAAEKYFTAHGPGNVKFCGRKIFVNVEHAAALYAAWLQVNTFRHQRNSNCNSKQIQGK